MGGGGGGLALTEFIIIRVPLLMAHSYDSPFAGSNSSLPPTY